MKNAAVKSDLQYGILARRVVADENGDPSTEVCIAIACQRCGKSAGEHWFQIHEPAAGLCRACRRQSDSLDVDRFKIEVDALSDAKPVAFVAGDCAPGESSGKTRKYIGSMGSGENANGCWDNLVRAMED